MGAVRPFLFAGPEFGERNDAVNELRGRFGREYGSLDEYSLYAGDTKAGEIAALLMNGSLFAASRFVVLKNAELIKKKEDIAVLSECIQSGAGGGAPSALVFVSDAIGIDKRLEALVPKQNKRIFWELFEERKEQWLHTFFKKNGFTIEKDAAGLILDMVENNTEALRTECSRFFLCFEQGHCVATDEVEKILAHNREESSFTLFEAMADASCSPQKRMELSVSILHKIRLSRESSGVQILAGLAYCFRRLKTWHGLYASGNPDEASLKAAGFSSKRMRGQYASAAKCWPRSRTDSILAMIAETDMQLRSLGAAAEDTALYLLIYGIVIKNGCPHEKYEKDIPVRRVQS